MNMSQRDLAQVSQISLRQIKNIEQGVTENPHPFTVRRLAEALNVDLEDPEILSATRPRPRRGPLALAASLLALVVAGGLAFGQRQLVQASADSQPAGFPPFAVKLTKATFTPTTLDEGGTVDVALTVKNTGDSPIKSFGPPPGTEYTTRTNYLDPRFNQPGNSRPPFADRPGVWRVGVGWSGSPPNYPARWGFFPDQTQTLMPGAEVTIKGSIKVLPTDFHDMTFWATVEQGGVGFSPNFGTTLIHIR